MDCQDYITESVERKKGQHLQREERSSISRTQATRTEPLPEQSDVHQPPLGTSESAAHHPERAARAGSPDTRQGVERRSTRRTESVLGNHTESVTALASFAG